MDNPNEPKVIVVGESNPYGRDPRYALYDVPLGKSGDRLRTLVMGLHRRSYYTLLARHNLCVGPFSMPKARLEAQRILGLYPNVPVIMLGRKVSEAFDCTSEFFFAVTSAGRPMLALPHPSPANRLWDEPLAYRNARRALADLVPSVPWGEVSNG